MPDPTHTSTRPSISVIVASYNAQATIRDCLRSLEDQATSVPYEMIVVDSSTDDTAGIVRQEFPAVGLLTSETRRYPGDARNLGIARAKGDILAFTDTDCIAPPDWIARIARAHERSDPAIGGAVRNGNPEHAVAWAAYFCEFSQWMPGAPESKMVEIPTCCLSLKRWAFDAFGPFLEGTYCSDSAFCWKLSAQNLAPLFVPEISVAHINISRFRRFITKTFLHGRSFARVRASEARFSRRTRTAYAAATPCLPPVLLGRVAARVFRRKHFRRQFLRTLPLVALGLTAWSAGEFVGYARSR